MAKPTRRQPAFNSVVESPQGNEFVGVIESLIGHGFSYRPIASFDSGRRHLFLLSGARGTGLLSEAWEKSSTAEAVARWAFTTNTANAEELCVTFTAVRWSAGQQLHLSGVDPFPAVPVTRRKKLEAQRRSEIGAAKDTLTIRRSATGTAWTDLSGIDRSIVDDELARHGIGLLVEPTPEPADGVPAPEVQLEMLLAYEMWASGAPLGSDRPAEYWDAIYSDGPSRLGKSWEIFQANRRWSRDHPDSHPLDDDPELWAEIEAIIKRYQGTEGGTPSDDRPGKA